MQFPPFDRITAEPDVCGGKPCVRGMRISVRRVLELLAEYPDRTELLREYPYLEDEDLDQALRFAAATVDDGAPTAGSRIAASLREAVEWSEGVQAGARVTKVDVPVVDVDDALKPGSQAGPSHT
ncbi:MAG: hypothetical protein C0504_18655 [Candidatus Solibacter sp.]|nr:hypothetical protein [Candidatus Solibacter sp.]